MREGRRGHGWQEAASTWMCVPERIKQMSLNDPTY
jgi:hypothetical protein